MCRFFGCKRSDPERAGSHDNFKMALVQQFNSLYETKVDDIQSRSGLSRALGIFPLPDDVKEAKKVIFQGNALRLACIKTRRETG